MKIHAMAAAEPSAPLAPYEYESPALGAYDCLLAVKSCGICHSDLHMIDNDWRISRYPLVAGHEVVGEVIEVGAQVRHLRPGDRVGVGWQRSACMSCTDCIRGDENLCSQSTGVISDGHGGFGGHMVMDSRFCFPIPDAIATDEAGPLLCGGATVYSALRQAGMRGAQRIGIIGVGGLGHMAVQFAARMGNRVTVFTTSPDKAEFAEKLGAREAVITGEAGRPRTPSRFDIILNTVPLALPWTDYLKLLDSDGTLSFVGVPNEPMTLPIGLLMGRRKRITSSPIAGRAEMTEMLRFAADQGVRPIIETFPLARANEAMQKVRDNTIRYRAVLVP